MNYIVRGERPDHVWTETLRSDFREALAYVRDTQARCPDAILTITVQDGNSLSVYIFPAPNSHQHLWVYGKGGRGCEHCGRWEEL